MRTLLLHLSDFRPVCTFGVWLTRKFTTSNISPVQVILPTTPHPRSWRFSVHVAPLPGHEWSWRWYFPFHAADETASALLFHWSDPVRRWVRLPAVWLVPLPVLWQWLLSATGRRTVLSACGAYVLPAPAFVWFQGWPLPLLFVSCHIKIYSIFSCCFLLKFFLYPVRNDLAVLNPNIWKQDQILCITVSGIKISSPQWTANGLSQFLRCLLSISLRTGASGELTCFNVHSII